MDVFRCLATNNPVGTDTRPVGQPCSCDVCKLDRKMNDAVLEAANLRSIYEPAISRATERLNECAEKITKQGALIDMLRAHAYAAINPANWQKTYTPKEQCQHFADTLDKISEAAGDEERFIEELYSRAVRAEEVLYLLEEYFQAEPNANWKQLKALTEQFNEYQKIHPKT